MKVFPEIDQGHPSYAAEMERHIHSAWGYSVFEVLWSGTAQYQKIIDRDGVGATRTLLQQIRTRLAEIDSKLAALAKIEANGDSITAAVTREIERLKEPDFRRDGVSGRLERVDNSGKIAQEIDRANAAISAAESASVKIASLKAERSSMAVADEMLTAALVMFCQAEAHRRSQSAEEPKEPAAPVFNVTVETPRPACKTTEIQRDSAHEAVRTVETYEYLPPTAAAS